MKWSIAVIADFKLAMRRLASTITLITSGRAETWTGMAATAIMSVTTDPPTVVIAVNSSASVHPVIIDTGAFCVNLLGAAHNDMVPVFSGSMKGLERFHHGDWRTSIDGLPVLTDAVSSLVCVVTDRMDVGTHSLFVGTAVEIDNHARIDPLLWIDGRTAQAAVRLASLGGL